MKNIIGIILLIGLAAATAWAELTATVQPGYQFSAGERPTVDTLNLLAKPSVSIAGTVSGTVGLAAGTVTGTHLADSVVDNITLDYNGASPRAIEIMPGGVTSNQLGNFTVQGTNIAKGTITCTNVAEQGIRDTNILTGTITDTQISPSAAIKTSKLALTAGIGITISGDTISSSLTGGSGITIAGGVISMSMGQSSQLMIPGYTSDLTVTHGLGAVPKMIRVVFVCTSATGPFGANDEVDMSTGTLSTTTTGGTTPTGLLPYAVSANGTTITLTALGNVWKLSAMGTSGSAQILTGSWKVRVYYAK
jgi:hypothetical protein